MALSDYQGRVVDVMAFQGADPFGKFSLDPALISSTSGGFLCTGIQKLAQRWILEFLTEKGSLRYLPLRGCTFLTAARAGNLTTELDVFQAFLLSKNAMENNLFNEETGLEPADERYNSCSLNSVVISQDTVTLNFTIVSRAGSSRKIIIPIDTTI